VDPLPSLERAHQRRVLEERPIFDRLVDAHEVLEQDAPGANRQVADLTVAHLARRQTDRLT